MNKIVKAHIALFLAQVLYAASFPIAKLVMEGIPPGLLVSMRVMGAIVLFWSTSIFINEKIDKKDIPKLILLALFGVAINQSLFLRGLHLTSPINAAIMMITSPILVLVIASLLIKERITMLKSVGILLGFAGAAFLIYSKAGGVDKQSSVLGDVLVLINAASWGTYLVLVKPLMKKYHAVTILKWTFVFGLPMIAPFGAIEAFSFDWSSLSTEIIWYTVFVIIFTTYIAYLLNTYSLNQLSPSVVSAYIYTQPLLTALIAIYIFNIDSLDWGKVVSACLIFIGVYLVSMKKK